MKDTYITAVLDLLAAGAPAAEVLGGLTRTLDGRGHNGLLPGILAGVLRQLEAGEAGETTITVAREADASSLREEIASALRELGADGEARTEVDDTLIGGFVVESGSKQLDASYKSKLVTLYRALTR